MAKNNVGSLYVEILLDSGGYKKGTAAIRKDQTKLSNFIENDIKETMSEREKAALEARRLGEANYRVNKNDAKKRALLQKQIIDSYKRRIKTIEKKEREHAQFQKNLALKEKARKEAASRREIERVRKEAAAKKAATLKAIGGLGKGKGGILAHFGAGGSLTSFLTGKGGVFASIGKITGALSALSMIVGKTALFVWPLVQAFKALGKAAGAVASVVMKGIKVIDSFRMQNIKIAKFMDGNVAGARKLVNAVEEYAIATSLSVDAGLDMAGSLLILGVRASDVTTRLKQFNSVALGDTEKFKRIAKAYTDVLGAGVLKRTELKQFTEAGVAMNQALEELLRAEGRFTGSIDQMISDKLITAQDVGKALDIIGEKFRGLDTAALSTVEGQFENIAEEIVSFVRHSKLLKEITDEVVKAMKKIGEVITDVLPIIEDVVNMLASTKLKTALTFINGELNHWYYRMKAIAMLHSFMKTGNWTEYNDRIKQAEIVAKIEEDIAKNKADQAEKEEAAAKKREENLRRYTELVKGMKPEDNTAQGKYQSWYAENNIADLDPMQRASLMSMYYQKELDAAKAERDKALDDISKDRVKNEEKRLEAALTAMLPQSAFRQGSVEEFRYLQQQRKQADRDRRREEMFQQDLDARSKEAEGIVDAITGLNLTNTGTTAI